MTPEARKRVIEEAMTWLRTPWHHRQMVKGEGCGVDCVHLLIGVYNGAGVANIDRNSIPNYPEDIMMHTGNETVLSVVERYAVEVEQPEPGDIVLWKFGRIYSHAAIVVEWPLVIHAYRPEGGVVLGDGTKGFLEGREVKFYTMRDK